MTEEMGFVDDVDFGLRDRGIPILSFNVVSVHGEALQTYLDWDSISQFVKNSRCYSINDMKGKPCIVEVEGEKITFVRWFNH